MKYIIVAVFALCISACSPAYNNSQSNQFVTRQEFEALKTESNQIKEAQAKHAQVINANAGIVSSSIQFIRLLAQKDPTAKAVAEEIDKAAMEREAKAKEAAAKKPEEQK